MRIGQSRGFHQTVAGVVCLSLVPIFLVEAQTLIIPASFGGQQSSLLDGR